MESLSGIFCNAWMLLFEDELKIYWHFCNSVVDFLATQSDRSITRNCSKFVSLHVLHKKYLLFHVNFSHERSLMLNGFLLLSRKDGICDLHARIALSSQWNLYHSEIVAKEFKAAKCISPICIEHSPKMHLVYCRPILERCKQTFLI